MGANRQLFRGGIRPAAITAHLSQPASPLDGLKVDFVPHFSVFDLAWLASSEPWVKNGEVLVIGARTASIDPSGNVIGESPPGVLRDLAGVRIEEYGRQNQLDLRPIPMCFRFVSGKTMSSDFWYVNRASNKACVLVMGKVSAFSSITTKFRLICVLHHRVMNASAAGPFQSNCTWHPMRWP